MITSDRPIVFIDSETTGLDPRFHEIWELALIVRTPSEQPIETLQFIDTEYLFQYWPELSRADSQSLAFNKFWDRVRVTPSRTMRRMTDQDEVALASDVGMPESHGLWLSKLLNGAHLVAANPSFDEPMLNKLLADRLGVAVQPWNYHKLDIEAMAVGWLLGNAQRMANGTDEAKAIHAIADNLKLPYSSSKLAEACGVSRSAEDSHTALADARWVRAWFDKITQ